MKTYDKEKRIQARKQDILIRTIKMGNVLLVTLPIILVWLFYYAPEIGDSRIERTVLLAVMFTILYSFFCKTYDAFLISYKRISDLFFSQTLAILFADAFMYIILMTLSNRFPNILPALAVLALQCCASGIWCIWVTRWYFRRFEQKKTAIVYDAHNYGGFINHTDIRLKFNVIKILQVENVLDNLDVLEDMEVVLYSGIHSHDRNRILKYCVENGIASFIVPRLGDVIMRSAQPMHLFHVPMLRVTRYAPSPIYATVKRTFDIVFSALLLILLSPVFCVIAIVIKTDGGPAFYRQTRLTRDGEKFRIIKFRSMKVNAEAGTGAVLSSGENDQRITKFGHFIRACRLDELPQLINIFKGEMSFVGPRPERPEIAEYYEKVLPEFHLRLQAKAGLTGYAQVYGKYNTAPYDKLNMDLMYIAQASVRLDIELLFATFAILFSKESTEGVEVGQTTAMDYENSTEGTEKDTDTVKK